MLIDKKYQGWEVESDPSKDTDEDGFEYEQ
jgi:hypothetical protein